MRRMLGFAGSAHPTAIPPYLLGAEEPRADREMRGFVAAVADGDVVFLVAATAEHLPARCASAPYRN
jgi:hypothetical protein